MSTSKILFIEFLLSVIASLSVAAVIDAWGIESVMTFVAIAAIIIVFCLLSALLIARHWFPYKYKTLSNELSFKDENEVRDVTVSTVKMLGRFATRIDGWYWWSGTGSEEEPILKKGENLKICLPEIDKGATAYYPYFICITEDYPVRHDVPYRVEQTYLDKDHTLEPYYSFYVSKPCGELSLLVDFSKDRKPVDGSVKGRVMRHRYFDKGKSSKIVGDLPVRNIHSSTWQATIHKPSLFKEYQIYWEWEN